jgi:hypothetical protein
MHETREQGLVSRKSNRTRYVDQGSSDIIHDGETSDSSTDGPQAHQLKRRHEARSGVVGPATSLLLVFQTSTSTATFVIGLLLGKCSPAMTCACTLRANCTWFKPMRHHQNLPGGQLSPGSVETGYTAIKCCRFCLVHGASAAVPLRR